MQESVNNILNTFDTLTLQELEAMNFIDRMDFKYTFNVKQLPEILLSLQEQYKVMSVNDIRYTDYNTHYYDTPDFSFYRRHHNGLSNRFKARVREYVQSKLFFLEVKYKNNKDWTSKYREKIKSNEETDIISKFKKLTQSDVEEKLIVKYRRITLIAKDKSEKITLDINLTYEKENESKVFDGIVIAEIKSKSRKRHTLRQILKDMGYREKGMSKYCFGITQMYHHLKTNNFKPLIRDIKSTPHHEFEHS